MGIIPHAPMLTRSGVSQGTAFGPLLWSIISLTHTCKWFPKISLITYTGTTICRWLPAIQSNQISPKPNQFRKKDKYGLTNGDEV